MCSYRKLAFSPCSFILHSARSDKAGVEADAFNKLYCYIDNFKVSGGGGGGGGEDNLQSDIIQNLLGG